MHYLNERSSNVERWYCSHVICIQSIQTGKKRKTSLGREQIASKQQLREDALHQTNFVKSFEFDENTKEAQTEPSCTSVSCITLPEVRSVSTQIEPVMNNFGVIYIIKQFDYVDKDEVSSSDYESIESEYHQSDAIWWQKFFREF